VACFKILSRYLRGGTEAEIFRQNLLNTEQKCWPVDCNILIAWNRTRLASQWSVSRYSLIYVQWEDYIYSLPSSATLVSLYYVYGYVLRSARPSSGYFFFSSKSLHYLIGLHYFLEYVLITLLSHSDYLFCVLITSKSVPLHAMEALGGEEV
jgi:hypothetical protein